jgi:hypothetical protein
MTETNEASNAALEYITRTWREMLTEPITTGKPSHVIIVPEEYDGFIGGEVLSWLRDLRAHVNATLLTLPADALHELSENRDFRSTAQGRVDDRKRVTLHDALGNLTAHVELPPSVFIARLPLPADSIIIRTNEAVLRAGWREETT